ADERAVAIRGRRIEDVVGGERAVDAVGEEQVGISHTAPDIVVLVAAHEEEVGRRQHRDGDAAVGEAAGERRHLVGRKQRQLGHVADYDAAAAAILSVSSRTRWMSMASGVWPTSRWMSMSTSKASASAKMRSIWPAWSVS